MSENKTWGGRRKGAGRPKPLEEMRRKNVYLNAKDIREIEELGAGNFSDGVRRLLRERNA